MSLSLGDFRNLTDIMLRACTGSGPAPIGLKFSGNDIKGLKSKPLKF